MMSRLLVTLCPLNVTNVTRVMIRVCGCCRWSLAGRRLRLRRDDGECREPAPDTRNTGDTERAAKIQGGGYRVPCTAGSINTGDMQLVTSSGIAMICVT